MFWVIVCILPLTINHASPTFLNRTVSSLACLVVPQFSTFSHRRCDFRGKKCIEHKMCVLIFSTTFAWNIYKSKNYSARDYYKYTQVFMYTRCYCRFQSYMYFLVRLSKNPQISSFMKILPVGVESIHADRQTNRHDDTNSHFLQFCKSA